MNRFCVYIIKDIRNGRVVYIGKTSNFDRRKNEHLSLNSNIKSELSEIGVENVSVEPIEYFEDEVKALKKEDELIIKYNTIKEGFNKQRSGLCAKDVKAYKKAYFQTEKGKEAIKRAIEKRKQNGYYKAYFQTEKGKNTKKESAKRYFQTEKGKEAIRRAAEKRKQKKQQNQNRINIIEDGIYSYTALYLY